MSNQVVFIAGKHPLERVGGHSNFVRAHARAAVRLGLHPHIFCVGPKTDTQQCEFGTIHQVASAIRPYRPIVISAHAPKLTRAVGQFISANPDARLIHTFGAWYGIASAVSRVMRNQGHAVTSVTSAYTTLEHEYRAKLAGAMRSAPVRQKIVQMAEFGLMRFVRSTREAHHFRDSDVILTNYDSVRYQIAAEYGTDIKCRKVGYASERAFLGDHAPPLPDDRWQQFKHPHAPVIVSVSRHDPRKGTEHLLAALARLRDSGTNFRAFLVGGGSLTSAHRKLALKLELEGWVSIEGWVPDPFHYLKQSDIFALPSTQEGSGSVAILEALQAGLPILASGIDGIPEDVSESEAILVPSSDASALAEGLKRLLTDHELRTRLASGARRKFEKQFTADAFIKSLGEVYGELGVPIRG